LATIETLWQDLRYGSRLLRRSPGFTLVVILTLAIGIGMNTAVFSVVNSVLLRPLPYPDSDRLVWLAIFDETINRPRLMGPDFLDYRAQAQSVERAAAYNFRSAAIATANQATQTGFASVAGDFWSITGARAVAGHLFGPEERDSIVLTWPLFERLFAGDRRMVGRTVALDGRQVTITGVLAPEFQFLLPMLNGPGAVTKVEAYTPLPSQARAPGQYAYVSAVAKLRYGVQITQALHEFEVIRERIATQNPAWHPLPARMLLRVVCTPLQEELVGGARRALIVLLGAGGFVLLIACANIANLLLAKSTTRRREMAIRAAMGAGRGRAIRQFLAEGVQLALPGGIAGLLLAWGALSMIERLGLQAVPRLAEVRMDGRVLAFTMAISLGAGILFAFFPALSLRRSDLQTALKNAARSSSAGSGRLRLRGFLVAVEIALAIVLLTGAGLMVKSFWRMYSHPAGFTPENILTARVSLSGPQYADAPHQAAYMRELVRRIETIPHVKAGIVTDILIFGTILKPGEPPLPLERVLVSRVSTGYFGAMGMRLIEGRWLTDTDPADAALINESLAKRFFKAENAIGRRIQKPGPGVTVAGVVADLKSMRLDAEPEPEMYMLYRQSTGARWAMVVVRTPGDPSSIAPAVRNLISGIDPAQPVYDIKTLEQELSDSIAPRRFNLFLLATFAGAALLLALVGIHGVISFSVTQRTHEIGVRMALGAQRNDVVRMVVLQAMTIGIAGIVTGLVAAAGLTRLMESLLYDVRTMDPGTFVVVAGVLAITALLASSIPAFRAARVDPNVALRYE
jgi:putative ABC transport system permease protein